MVTICSLNDLSVIAEDQFYFTNLFYSEVLPLPYMEMMTGINSGSVGFYDGSKGGIIVTRLSRPNGINKSPDNK